MRHDPPKKITIKATLGEDLVTYDVEHRVVTSQGNVRVHRFRCRELTTEIAPGWEEQYVGMSFQNLNGMMEEHVGDFHFDTNIIPGSYSFTWEIPVEDVVSNYQWQET